MRGAKKKASNELLGLDEEDQIDEDSSSSDNYVGNSHKDSHMKKRRKKNDRKAVFLVDRMRIDQNNHKQQLQIQQINQFYENQQIQQPQIEYTTYQTIAPGASSNGSNRWQVPAFGLLETLKEGFVPGAFDIIERGK